MKNLACNRILQKEQPCSVWISAGSWDLNIFATQTLFFIFISSYVSRQHDFVDFNC